MTRLRFVATTALVLLASIFATATSLFAQTTAPIIYDHASEAPAIVDTTVAHNGGINPLWWVAVAIVVVILVGLALRRLMNRKPAEEHDDAPNAAHTPAPAAHEATPAAPSGHEHGFVRTSALAVVAMVIVALGVAIPAFAQAKAPRVLPVNIVIGNPSIEFTIPQAPACDPTRVIIEPGVDTTKPWRQGDNSIHFWAFARPEAVTVPVNVEVRCQDGTYFATTPFAVVNRSVGYALGIAEQMTNDSSLRLNQLFTEELRKHDEAIAALQKQIDDAKKAAAKRTPVAPKAPAKTAEQVELERRLHEAEQALANLKAAPAPIVDNPSDTRLADLEVKVGLLSGIVAKQNDMLAQVDNEAYTTQLAVAYMGDSLMNMAPKVRAKNPETGKTVKVPDPKVAGPLLATTSNMIAGPTEQDRRDTLELIRRLQGLNSGGK